MSCALQRVPMRISVKQMRKMQLVEDQPRFGRVFSIRFP